jgi:hypothetical protein
MNQYHFYQVRTSGPLLIWRLLMLYKKISVTLILSMMLAVGAISLAQAAPPGQEGTTGGSTFGETLDLDGDDDSEPPGKNNLGTIMSGRKDGDTIGDEPDDGTSEDDASGDDGTGDPPDDGTGGDDTGDGTEPGVKEHPVASAIAEYFGVEYGKIMSLHEAGNGFGNIAKAYFFANRLELSLTPEGLLQQAHESGWGNVLKEQGIHPGTVGNGGSKRPAQAGPSDNVGPGNDGPPGQLKKESNLVNPANGDAELVGPGGNNGNGNGRDNNGNGKGNNGNGGGNGHGNNGNGRNK